MTRRYYLRLFLILIPTALSSKVLNRLGVDKENILMVFMVGVLLVTALTRGYRFGIIASFMSVMIFNYFFAEPLKTFTINNTNDVFLMLFFLIASIISSSLTARFQRQLLISQKNEHTVKLLYEISQCLFNVTGVENIVRQGICCTKEYAGYDSAVVLSEGTVTVFSNEAILDNDRKSVDLPIEGIVKRLGTLKIYSKEIAWDMEQELLVKTIATQIGIALDREFAYNERVKIRNEMEREHIKSNLLRGISHDLRTPLTGIAGASSYLAQHGKSLDRTNIEHLAKDINEQAVWLTTMVENILNMTKIGDGKLVVNKQYEVVDDVVHEAIRHVPGLTDRKFKLVLPNDLIVVPMDGKLITQVLVNLLDNAVTHAPKDSLIGVCVTQKENYVEFCVEDGGKGIGPLIDNIFEAFVTSGKTGADGRKGIGLGLTICKTIVKAHGGCILVDKSPLGGSAFKFRLPNGKEVDKHGQ